MKRLDVTLLAIETAVLAFGLQGANASDDREHEREGWAALASIRIEGTETSAPQAGAAREPLSSDCNPFEESPLDRGSLGLPEPVLVPQMGGLLAYKSDEQSASAWATDCNLIAPAP